MSENFPQILESALSKPENFFNSILPQLEPLTTEKLGLLAKTLESGTVMDIQLVTKLFIDYLKESGAKYLTSVLDLNNAKLFIASANIIGELAYEPALESLKKALKKEHPELVLPALKAISLLSPTPSVISTLADFYINFTDEVLLAKSIRYLATRSNELVPVFLDEYPKLPKTKQMFLLDYFATVADPRTEDLLISEYKKSPCEKGVFCIDGLGHIGSDKAVEALAQALKSPEWFLRKHIVTALGVSDNANAITPLLGALDDKHVLVRGAAVKSLSLVGNKNPDALIETLKLCNKKVKASLVRVMGLLKNEKFVESLTDVLRERDILFFSIDALGDLDCPQGEFALRRLLKDEVWFNRLNALEALAKLHSRELATFAQEALEDPNDMVRNSASRILTSLRGQ